MKVKELMTTKVVSIRRNQSLSDAARLMWDCDCGSIPVMEESGQRIVGMVTDRDICMACWSQDRAPSSLLVADATSRELFACSPEDSLAYAGDLMRAKQIRRVPVIDSERRLIGILSLADIAAECRRPGRASNELAPTEIASTLANICQPRSSERQRAFA